ncbi:MAG: DUF6282 family protein [Chloroflexota bacterium]
MAVATHQTEASVTTQARYLSSYMARRQYADEIQYPPASPGVKGTVDIHAHAHEGQQDALALAQHASASGMGGILYKTIVGRQRPAEAVRQVQEQLKPWCDENKVEPVKSWAGWNIGSKLGVRATAKDAQEQIEDGVAAIWMPNNLHANTFAKVGARPIWWDKTANPRYNTDPMDWDHAVSVGAHYLMDEHSKLANDVQDVFRVIADKDVAVFFGHATHPEIFAMAEQVEKLGIKKAVVDHPFSPFVDLSVEQMRQLNKAGIYMNFTYDEISPLLGVDPAIMCKTIQALGTQYVTLSSDCGEPLFPNSVEGMRQIRAYMRAFGLTDQEVEQISVDNPARVAGLA